MEFHILAGDLSQNMREGEQRKKVAPRSERGQETDTGLYSVVQGIVVGHIGEKAACSQPGTSERSSYNTLGSNHPQGSQLHSAESSYVLWQHCQVF